MGRPSWPWQTPQVTLGVLYLSPGQHLTALSFDSSPGREALPGALAGVLTMEMQTLQVVHET